MNPFTPKRLDDFDDDGKLCPILADPLPECYCFDITSMKIIHAIKYCLNDYLACEIYQSAKAEKKG